MHRRHFLGAGLGAMAGGAAMRGQWPDQARAGDSSAARPASELFDLYTADDHRRRLENIRLGEQGVGACLRKHLIAGYLPGQCCYNLGEYPSLKRWEPGEPDEQELDRLRDHGVQLVQVHEEWNDSQRLFGGNKFTPVNPAGFRRFVEMVHRRGMKLIVYVSSGYFERTDPDFRRQWARNQDLVEIYYRNACCSPASPAWRAYLLPRLRRILDDYGVDGFYNDLGYVPLAGNPQPPTPDEVLAFPEAADRDEALGDLLHLLYEEVHRRGGVMKVHYCDTHRPLTDLKVYDYLWVGEAASSGDSVREAVKDYLPYVVPCVDMSRAKIDNEDELYLHALPYMQFPLLLAGRPVTGQRAAVPGVRYTPDPHDYWTRHFRAIWTYYQAHPQGPYSYGWWDSVPGRPEARPTHARWLKLYRPMVEEGTWAWLEVRDSALLARPPEKGVVVSAFANRNFYLAVANYQRRPATIQTRDAYVSASAPGAAARSWPLAARSLLILTRAESRA
jgi:hypothetical protein